METIELLIDDFLREAEYAANCFYKKYYRKDLLIASKDGTIIRSGKIEGLQHYAFHGIGLYAKRKNCEIDFDFGLNDRIDGFDTWRLNQFAQSRKEKKEKWTEDKIKNELVRLEQMGKISKLKDDISSNYYRNE
ncbi:DUF6896 domain-containing protein [uncultured Acetobacteroides sp.]|uniref:DUF6896 domain-containing protein n=1 Tax=uncultured Acetobacteroides sp. TaxID=1760811 RepID=UPI0029F5407B|nr:hypothetical protein [uncultured Acetobacteroides sp.]